MRITWLKVDVGLPCVLRCRTALPTPRAPNVAMLMAVSSTVPRRPRRGLSLYLMGQFVTAVPQCSSSYAKISWARSAMLFQEIWRITEMDGVEMFISVLVAYCESEARCQ